MMRVIEYFILPSLLTGAFGWAALDLVDWTDGQAPRVWVMIGCVGVALFFFGFRISSLQRQVDDNHAAGAWNLKSLKEAIRKEISQL